MDSNGQALHKCDWLLLRWKYFMHLRALAFATLVTWGRTGQSRFFAWAVFFKSYGRFTSCNAQRHRLLRYNSETIPNIENSLTSPMAFCCREGLETPKDQALEKSVGLRVLVVCVQNRNSEAIFSPFLLRSPKSLLGQPIVSMWEMIHFAPCMMHAARL